MDDGGPVNAVREDPKRKGLLYASTERGVYVSFDDGEHWQSLRLNLPRDIGSRLIVKDDDLAVATHGRGFWILDDITPLRQIAATTANRTSCCSSPPTRVARPLEHEYGHAVAEGRADIAESSRGYHHRLLPEVSLERTGHAGSAHGDKSARSALFEHRHMAPIPDVSTPPVPLYWYRPPQRLAATAGMHRFYWDLRYQPLAEGGGGRGGLAIQAVPFNSTPASTTPLVAPGTYTVKLTVNGRSYTQPLSVKQDPRVPTPALHLNQLYALMRGSYFDAANARAGLDSIRQLREAGGKTACCVIRCGQARARRIRQTARGSGGCAGTWRPWRGTHAVCGFTGSRRGGARGGDSGAGCRRRSADCGTGEERRGRTGGCPTRDAPVAVAAYDRTDRAQRGAHEGGALADQVAIRQPRHGFDEGDAMSVPLALVVCVASVPSTRSARSGQATQLRSSFASLVAELSEPPGYFDTDNLISNERSYLHVVPELRALAGHNGRGVYLGVGPDQNFSYIAHLRPSLAIVIDIRRENLLLHLLFKALFAEAQTRVEYLAMLTGRPPPLPLTEWRQRSIEEMVAYIDRTRPLGESDLRATRVRLTRLVDSFGVPLDDNDRATIDRFHRRFIDEGLSLQFNSFGRPPQYGYPDFRDLLLEVDGHGTRRSYLASEDDFQFVKGLQTEDRIVPIVGDLSGATALAAVAKFLSRENLQVSAFYTSNVEFYLFRAGRFADFIANIRRLPRLPAA